LYFLLPDVEVARKVVDELLLSRVEDRHIHVVAKEGTPLEDLPQASMLEKTDFIPALEKGLAYGGVTGLLASLVAITFPPAGLVLGGGAVLGIALAGAGVGAWLSSMIGVDVPNSRLKEFEAAIRNGEVLLIADVPKARVTEIDEAITKHHSEVEIHRSEPTVPAFP
jgi:hypothetical protein